jgi:hypothetical protein
MAESERVGRLSWVLTSICLLTHPEVSSSAYQQGGENLRGERPKE